MLGLEMADDRLDGGSALHLAANGLGDAADLAADPDPELVRVVVAAIAPVDVNAAGLDARQLLDRGDDRAEGVPVVRIAVQRLRMQYELTAFGLGDRGCHRDLATELVGRPRLTFADAFDLRRMQGIDFVAALAMILMSDAEREIEQRAEARLERVVAGDLAADVADDAAE